LIEWPAADGRSEAPMANPTKIHQDGAAGTAGPNTRGSACPEPNRRLLRGDRGSD
jgi:hypothetical protein